MNEKRDRREKNVVLSIGGRAVELTFPEYDLLREERYANNFRLEAYLDRSLVRYN